MGIERQKGKSTSRGKALRASILVIVGALMLLLFSTYGWLRSCAADERDSFKKVKEAVKKSGKPHYCTEALIETGTTKERILIVFIDAAIPDWSVSYHAVDGASRVLFIGKPSLTRSIAFERWATHESKR